MAPWRLYQNYPLDVLLMRHGPIADDVRFERVRTTARQPA
jgi:monooxygenase